MAKSKFPFFSKDQYRTGALATLLMMCEHLGLKWAVQCLKKKMFPLKTKTTEETALLEEYANICGLKVRIYFMNFIKLKKTPLPVIALLKKNRLVVVYKISNDLVFIANPHIGLVELKEEEYIEDWIKLDIPTAGKKNKMPGVIFIIERKT